MASGFRNYRWLICALLFLATTINYIDRSILALLKETLDREIGWTNEQFGWVNASFQLAYALGLLAFGWFVDRFGTKVGYAVSIAAWSLAAMGHALVGTFRGFIFARIGLGFSEGGNFPSAIKAVALWFPKKERALATSIFNAGANVGAIIAPAFIPWLASTDSVWGWKAFCIRHGWDQSLPWLGHTWGWQAAFVAAGVVGLLWLLLWGPFYNVPEKIRRLNAEELQHIRSDADELANQPKMPWLSLLGYRQTWSFVVAKFLTDPVWWFFLIWLPDYFNKTRGLDIKHSWVHIVTIYTIVTVLSIFGGWITGFLAERGWTITRARKTGMFVFTLCVLPILIITTVGDWTAVMLIGLAGAAHQAWSANLFTTVSDMFPKRAVASVVGIGGMAGSIGGFLFPIFTGAMLDHFKAGGNITAGYAILFGICAAAYLVAFGLNHVLAPKFELVEIKGA
ncbi:MAG: MFS transporter [Verrucomicrobiota bacterium]|jgi:ACS family hexuronate transporter-like MFS transporter